MSARVVWATAVRDGSLAGDVHAWCEGEAKSVCGRMVRAAQLERPRFLQRAAAKVGCPSCIKALARKAAA